MMLFDFKKNMVLVYNQMAWFHYYN